MEKHAPEIVHTIVFADGPNGGNPCPVILSGSNLSAQQGMAYATQFGAETIIIDKASEAGSDFALRYFVPEYEMEMCIHGTIAAVTVMKERGLIKTFPVVIETSAGRITANYDAHKNGSLVTVDQFPANFSSDNPTNEEITTALGISIADLHSAIPAISVSVSRYKLIIPLVNAAIIDRLQPNYELLWELCERYNTTGFYPFGIDPEKPEYISARQFPKKAGYNEDPATGVAAGALAAYLAHFAAETEGEWKDINIRQGYAMGKPSLISARAKKENGKITKVQVSGHADILPI